MKRIIYSAVVLFALVAVSCTKEEIKKYGAQSEVPVWRGASDNNGAVDPNDGGKITDPNNDPESSSPVVDDN